MSCEECQAGIQTGLTQILDPAIIAFLIEVLQGEAFCATYEDERCAEGVAYLLTNGLPLLAAAVDPADLPAVCNQAIEGTCPARRMRLI